MKSDAPVSARIVLVWLLLLIIALSTRPLLPPPETRYLSVAWEMWSSGDLLVMHLNGEPYSHKPPLLFWIINLFWWLFGVNEWSARLVSPLFGLPTLLLTAALAKRLWPDSKESHLATPWVLLGSGAWALYNTITMFDMLLAFFTVVAAWGIHLAWCTQRWQSWLLVTLGIGGGLLTKGPAIFVSVLPLALLAPWWAKQAPAKGWRCWYRSFAMATLFGIAIALTWAIPAAIVGGPEYRQALFWGQTANRVIESFAHRHPWWWYLPLLPILLFPWLLWSKFWRALLQFNLDQGERFCIVWCLSTLLIFSLISGKQVHYLFPAFPAFALLAARRLTRLTPAPFTRGERHRGLGVIVIVVGIFAVAIPYSYGDYEGLEGLANVSPLWGGVVSAIGAGLILWRTQQMKSTITKLSLATLFIVSTLHLGIFRAIAPAYDLTGVATQLASAQMEGKSVACFGNYHGEYHFLGRLTAPIAELSTETELQQWAIQNSDGVVIRYYGVAESTKMEQEAIYSQDYRSKRIALIPASVYLRPK